MDTTEAAVQEASPVWPHIGAYVLLSGGLTMVFLAASTIASSPAIATPGLVAPALVAVGLALQRGLPLASSFGEGVRADITALAAAFGPFVIVLAMVLSGQQRVVDLSWSGLWTAGLAAVAELGWWGYLYPMLRQRIQPLPAALAVGIVRIGWLGLLAWAGANPVSGASPLLLTAWSLVLAVLTAAILEFRPWSLLPVLLLELGMHTAIALLPFAPSDAGTSGPMRTAVVTLLVVGLATMVAARSEAVARARHARVIR